MKWYIKDVNEKISVKMLAGGVAFGILSLLATETWLKICFLVISVLLLVNVKKISRVRVGEEEKILSVKGKLEAVHTDPQHDVEIKD